MVSANKYLEALAKGQTGPIEEIYEACFPKVRGFVLSNKGDLADAEDIFQKALMQLAVRYRREPFEIQLNFEVYLLAVCKNLWRREINKSKNRVTTDELVHLQVEEEDQAMALVEQQRYELFSEKLKQLSENCRQILTLYFAKTSYAEIVSIGKYNSETVARQRVFKCKKRLTDLIKSDRRFFTLKTV